MPLHIEERLSDSPYVERIWRSRSENIDLFTSIAGNRFDLVFWRQDGQTHVNLQGPETHASIAPVPQDAAFFGILFKVGAFMPHLPIEQMVDANLTLPGAAGQSFWLKSAAWQFPTYDNADTFVSRLVRDGLLAFEPVVDDMLRGYVPSMSLRSIQRRFLRATGLTYNTIVQTERARQATILLREGGNILDTAYDLGYFDQSHLTKSLKYFIGQTPAQLTDTSRYEQLSFLYKTPFSP